MLWKAVSQLDGYKLKIGSYILLHDDHFVKEKNYCRYLHLNAFFMFSSFLWCSEKHLTTNEKAQIFSNGFKISVDVEILLLKGVRTVSYPYLDGLIVYIGTLKIINL